MSKLVVNNKSIGSPTGLKVDKVKKEIKKEINHWKNLMEKEEHNPYFTEMWDRILRKIDKIT